MLFILLKTIVFFQPKMYVRAVVIIERQQMYTQPVNPLYTALDQEKTKGSIAQHAFPLFEADVLVGQSHPNST